MGRGTGLLWPTGNSEAPRCNQLEEKCAANLATGGQDEPGGVTSTFVEIGALDGVLAILRRTYLLEKCFG